MKTMSTIYIDAAVKTEAKRQGINISSYVNNILSIQLGLKGSDATEEEELKIRLLKLSEKLEEANKKIESLEKDGKQKEANWKTIY